MWINQVATLHVGSQVYFISTKKFSFHSTIEEKYCIKGQKEFKKEQKGNNFFLKKKPCLINKMDSGSQENNQLFMAIRLDSFTNGFDKHNGYHSLASTCLQHCYSVPLLCNFKHLQLVPTQPKKIHIHIHTLLKSRNTQIDHHHQDSKTRKRKKQKQTLWASCT